MSDFKIIETQEQFDAAIKERLARAEKVMAEKYAGYIAPDDYKKKTDELSKQVADLSSQLKEANTKVQGNDAVVADLNAKIKGYEVNAKKISIANELGLPFELAGRITGETDEEIRKDAETLVGFVGKKTITPTFTTEVEKGGADETSEALKQLSKSIFNQGEK